MYYISVKYIFLTEFLIILRYNNIKNTGVGGGMIKKIYLLFFFYYLFLKHLLPKVMYVNLLRCARS